MREMDRHSLEGAATHMIINTFLESVTMEN